MYHAPVSSIRLSQSLHDSPEVTVFLGRAGVYGSRSRPLLRDVCARWVWGSERRPKESLVKKIGSLRLDRFAAPELDVPQWSLEEDLQGQDSGLSVKEGMNLAKSRVGHVGHALKGQERQRQKVIKLRFRMAVAQNDKVKRKKSQRPDRDRSKKTRRHLTLVSED